MFELLLFESLLQIRKDYAACLSLGSTANC